MKIFSDKYRETKWKQLNTRVKLYNIFTADIAFDLSQNPLSKIGNSLFSWQLLIFGINYITICFNFS